MTDQGGLVNTITNSMDTTTPNTEIEGETFQHDKRNDTDGSKSKLETAYVLYGYRHFELALYCLAAMSN